MGFRCQHHHAAIDERHAVLKNRPKWQDVVPKTKAGRTAYEIAARHEKKFASAFRAAVSSLLPMQLPPGFKAAWESRSMSGMISALPLFSKEKQAEVYEQFRSSLANAYLAVIRESGKAEEKEVKAKFGVKKADGKEFAEVAVVVNPRSVKWIKGQSLKLIKEGMTKEQGKTVRAIIKDSFSKGVRAEEVYSNIKQNIGLTSRDYQAVLNRRDLHERAGLPKAEIERLTNEYREQKFEERAERIARTETIAAQAEGRQEAWQTMKEEGQLPEVRRKWVAAPPGGKTCTICYDDLDGQEVEIDEPYTTESGDTYDGPPAHPQCLPGDAVILPMNVSGTSERMYCGDIVILNTAAGNKIACTPNHLILGRSGWVAAKDFKLFDNVVGSRNSEWLSSFLHNNHDNSPTSIHQKVQAFRKSRKVFSVPVPTATKDFHGDGMQSDVAVIGAYGLLRNGGHALHLKKTKQNLLVDRVKSATGLFCRSKITPFGKIHNTSSRCFVCPFGVSSVLFGCSLGHHESIGREQIPNEHTPLPQKSSDFWSADAKGFCNTILGLSSQITLDHVIRIDVQRFTGLVYNLETSHNWYIAQNIINHNCRCTEVLVRIGDGE